MPEGADPKENFKDYVLGTYDKLPKTPQWASQISAYPRSIRSLAMKSRRRRTGIAVIGSSGAAPSTPIRWPQMFVTFGAMTGHMGMLRHLHAAAALHTTSGMWMDPLSSHLAALAFPALPTRSRRRMQVLLSCPSSRDQLTIMKSGNAILDGKYTAGYKDIETSISN